jgi:hypothetical protein
VSEDRGAFDLRGSSFFFFGLLDAADEGTAVI